MTIVARPPTSGMIVTGERNGCVSSSEAPKNAAVQPTAASAIASGSRGDSGSAGGASSNVSTARISELAAIAAMTQNSGLQACDWACSPPTAGPSATAPKIQRFMIIAVVRSLLAG